MKDNFDITCSDIRKKLKAFLDDLLAEDEYRAFVLHLDGCRECKDYVRKIGAISNQLWELGDVKAPSDLGSTIFFRLKQAEQEIRKPKFVISKKWLVGAVVFIFVIAALLFGISYLKRQVTEEIDETPTVEVYIERRPAINNHEAKLLFEKLKEIAVKLGVLEEKGPIDRNSNNITTNDGKPSTQMLPLEESSAVDITTGEDKTSNTESR